MRKILFVPLLLILLLLAPIGTIAESDVYQPAEKSQEELMMDMFLSLLLPTIQEDVANYYSDYLTTSPLVYPYEIKILNMERTNNYRGYLFSISIEVLPMLGAHNPVGRDHLTYTINPAEAALKEFKHLESFELPEHLKGNIKKK